MTNCPSCGSNTRTTKGTIHTEYETRGCTNKWHEEEKVRKCDCSDCRDVLEELQRNDDFLRRSVGACHLMISRDDVTELNGDWDKTDLPPRLRKYIAHRECALLGKALAVVDASSTEGRDLDARCFHEGIYKAVNAFLAQRRDRLLPEPQPKNAEERQ
jgi:hypothetical protein